MCTLTHLTLCASLSLLAGLGHAGTPIDETRPMDPDGVVDLDLTNAIVRISGTDADEFHIAGELGDQVDDFELRDSSGNIHFQEEWRRRGNNWGWNWGGNDSDGRGCWFGNDDEECQDLDERFSRLDIQVPRGSVLRLNSINGDVLVSDLTNNTNVSVVNASVTLTNLEGSVKADTVNGTLDAENLRGRVSLETVNGEITDLDSTPSRIDYSAVNGDILSNVQSDDISAEAVNGDMEFTLAKVRDLHLTSVGGRIDVDATLADDADVDISTVHGRISLTVPESTSARFLVDTEVNGRINNQLSDDEPERENRYVNSSNLNFSVNGGAADVKISTVSGNVALRKK